MSPGNRWRYLFFPIILCVFVGEYMSGQRLKNYKNNPPSRNSKTCWIVCEDNCFVVDSFSFFSPIITFVLTQKFKPSANGRYAKISMGDLSPFRCRFLVVRYLSKVVHTKTIFTKVNNGVIWMNNYHNWSYKSFRRSMNSLVISLDFFLLTLWR